MRAFRAHSLAVAAGHDLRGRFHNEGFAVSVKVPCSALCRHSMLRLVAEPTKTLAKPTVEVAFAARTDVGVVDDHGRSLLHITSALAGAVATADVYEAIVDQVALAIRASTCGLWLADGGSLRLARQVGYLSHTVELLADVPIATAPAMPMLDCFKRGEPMWIPSQRALLASYPHLVTAATRGRAYRVSCLPLICDNETVGTLAMTLDEERESTESERSFLLLVARYASQALERLRILDAERRSRQRADAIARRMTILSQASRAFGAADVEHEQRLESIVREVGVLLDCATTISLVRDDGRLHSVASYHPDPDAHALTRTLGRQFPLNEGEGLSGKVLQTRESVLLSKIDPALIAARGASAYQDFFRRFPVYAALLTPLQVRGRAFGVLSATRVRAGQEFDSEDLELLQSLAERAASAIENSRLHHQAEQARQRAERLYTFANAAVVAETLSQVFEAALEAIAGALGTDRAAILLFDENHTMRFKAWRGLSDTYRASVDGHSPWSRDEQAPKPVLVADCLDDSAWSGYASLFRDERIGALAFIPLVSRGQLLGKFMVYYDAPHDFTTAEVEVSRAIANHLASMVARFRAVADLEQTIRDNELFAGVLAHDLRNPLGAIVTATQLALMYGDGAGERANKPLTRVLAASDRMTRMIEQLLDFTRARVGGGIEIRPVYTSVLDIVNQAVSELDLVHADRVFEVSAQGDHHGVWDPDRLLQVVSNLLANACRHGEPAGSVKVTIDGRDPSALAFTVHNRGTVPAPLMPHIFEPFRGRERRHGDSRGLGLGLYIVRAIVRAHHGTVDVASDPLNGTTFTVHLPRG